MTTVLAGPPAGVAQVVVWANTTPRSMAFRPGPEWNTWVYRGLDEVVGLPDCYATGAQVTMRQHAEGYWMASVETEDGRGVGPVEYGDTFQNAALHLLFTLPPQHYGTGLTTTPRTLAGRTAYGRVS